MLGVLVLNLCSWFGIAIGYFLNVKRVEGRVHVCGGATMLVIETSKEQKVAKRREVWVR